MTDTVNQNEAPTTSKRIPNWVWLGGISLSIYAVVSYFILRANPDVAPRFRFSVEPLLATGAIVQVHVAGALSAFVIGVILLLRPKGVGLHKTLGWLWVVSMAVTAISSFFIIGLMGASYSPIHALSAWTMIGLPFGIAAIRRKNVVSHRRHMKGMFTGGILIAGLFSFLPGRVMWKIFFAG